MGCTVSKLDDLPAVALCRERCNFLDEAIRYRYSFADSHVAYIHSLKGFAVSFDRFFDLHFQDPENFTPPVLPLPPQRKGDPDPPPDLVHNPPQNTHSTSIPVIHHQHSHSNSGSHLQFHSDSEEDDDDDDEDHHHEEDDDDDESDEFGSHHHFHDHDHETLGSMPMPMHNGGGNGYMTMPMHNGGGNGYMTMNYMQNRSTTSVLYQQRPMSPETVHFGEASSSSSSNAYNPYSSYPNNSYDQSNAYYNHPPPPPVYSNYGGFYGSSSPPPPYMAAAQLASSSKPPPPPPSPPRASAWDFLNPFEIYERYYPPQTPSRDSREVREEEGIPDLEDEDYQQEVVKEVHGDHKFPNFSDGGGGGNGGNGGNFSKDEGGGGGGEREKGGGGGEREKGGGGEAGIHQAKNNVAESPAAENDGGVKYEVHVVDKKVVANEEQSEEKNKNVGAFKSRGGSRDVSEVVREIKDQFEKASDAGIEVSKMLEAGKLPYNKRHSVYQVSSKMLHSITPSLSVVSSQPSASGAVYLGVDEDVGISLRNLSSTLQKLYIWEKKLYEEVKVEEKMRLIHDRKCRRLKRLDEKGAEAHKVDSTRTLVRALSTKIGMAIQVVEKISITISKLRDEELWPQINELIHGLVRMWKVMLESHRNQFQAMSEAKNLDALAFNRKLNDTNLEATVQLQLELLNWIVRFSSWVVAQKAFVSALNSWLLKCLLNEPEETADGIAPFSPGRMGAPPVFVICNQWSQAMERISEKEVIDTMRVFAMSVHHLCKQNNMELRQRMTANRDMERRVKALEREEQKMQKALQVADKQMVMVSGQNYGLSVPDQIVQPSDTSNTSLQSGLRQIFEAMERFTGNSMQAYEELRVRSEEQRLGPENARVP